MRIISGKFKGRVIDGFNLEGTRPTMDRVKESLFAMIQEKIAGSICLDLFSGSGNLGLEAISEGGAKVYFADSSKKAISTIKKNIEKFDVGNNSEILFMDYKRALETVKDKKIDIIFLDPPYNTNYIEEAIKLIEKYELLNEKGIIICESDNLDKIIYSDKFREVKLKKYGDKYIVILEKI